MVTDTLSITRLVRIDPTLRYCEHDFACVRRHTRVVRVGDVGIGGTNPIRIQSMTTTNTMDTDGSIRQIRELVDAGCEIVRLTAPSLREAENLKAIRDGIRRLGVKVPLVADIHFTPNAALKAVEHVEKVRINPGNYADKKKFVVMDYSDADYERELERVEALFKPLILKCKTYGVALRIGTNHGSLSDRIMNRFGDTPAGMVESALEFVRMCERYDFHDIVLSMKSSNPQVMVAAYRLLAARMLEAGMDYPFHLGVTEAGDGEDARIKSAIGIGALLEDGIGDTIRVSLTEDSVHEIPAARQITHAYDRSSHSKFSPAAPWTSQRQNARNPYAYGRRWSQTVEMKPFNIGGVHAVRVEWTVDQVRFDDGSMASALVHLASAGTCPEIVSCQVSSPEDLRIFREAASEARTGGSAAAFCAMIDGPWMPEILNDADMISWMPLPGQEERGWREDVERLINETARHEKKALRFDLRMGVVPDFVEPSDSELSRLATLGVLLSDMCRQIGFANFVLCVHHPHVIAANRWLDARLHEAGQNPPILLAYDQSACKDCSVLFQSSVAAGSLLLDGIGDAIGIRDNSATPDALMRLHYNILQATRLRISKTEFISCPSCGRTLFDLQEVTSRIKARTGHLKGVKIAIMGCIVNGPGEMADADFGYVGSGAGKINLYVGKELVERNIDMAVADDRLIDLIRRKGMWTDPNAPTNPGRSF